MAPFTAEDRRVWLVDDDAGRSFSPMDVIRGNGELGGAEPPANAVQAE
jgi:hypothetical protein